MTYSSLSLVLSWSTFLQMSSSTSQTETKMSGCPLFSPPPPFFPSLSLQACSASSRLHVYCYWQLVFPHKVWRFRGTVASRLPFNISAWGVSGDFVAAGSAAGIALWWLAGGTILQRGSYQKFGVYNVFLMQTCNFFF